VERRHARTQLTTVGRISAKQVATALRKVESMNQQQKLAVIDEIYLKQPNLLASCVVQAKFGADEHTVEFLINILLVCYLAMAESGYEWPLIAVEEQEANMARMVGAIRFSEDLPDSAAAEAARAQYVAGHPEQALLALVVSQCGGWLVQLAQRNAEKESDKFVMMASMNIVNCIAHAAAQKRRAC
jgi:hypothetical protein